VSCASRTVTFMPARASTAAHVRPFGPDPTTIASPTQLTGAAAGAGGAALESITSTG
jgi:hypothetical protein